VCKVDEEKCDGCGTVAVCPQCAVVMPEFAVVNADLCIDCKICVNICPVGALE